MADSEMSEHVTTLKMELFCARALDESEQNSIAPHLSECSDCAQQLVATLGRQKGTTRTSFTLAPEFWLRHQHIDYEQLVEFTDNKLQAADRELIDVHLQTCVPCREDVQSFIAFRKQIAPEMEVSYDPVALEPARQKFTLWHPLQDLAWKPIYAAALALLATAIVIAAVFLKRRADDYQALQTPTPNVNVARSSQTPTPDHHAANSPTPSAGSTVENPKIAVVSLNDRGGTVTVDADGNLSGLVDVPASTRDEIARVLLSERIERPSILKDLDGEGSALRGTDSRQSFKLLSPVRTVLVSDRPTFKWEKLSGARIYRVYVNDLGGNVIAKSEELSSDRAQWTVTTSLKRGQIYAWTVVAVVEGREIVSPAPSSAEMKFRVLAASKLQQLNFLRKTRSHLALGVFFAREGMIAEAEREFQLLLRDNPGSRGAKKLLAEIRAWKTSR